MRKRLINSVVGDGKDDQSVAKESPPRFPLLRYYLITSLVVIISVTVALVLILVARAERDFTERSTDRGRIEGGHIAQMFYQNIGAPKFQENPNRTLQDLIVPDVIGMFARRSTFGLNIVRMSFVDLQGQILWSSDSSLIGQSVVDTQGYITVASQGVASARLQKNLTIINMAGERRKGDLITTFYPIRNTPLDSSREGSLIGVLNLDQDVTGELANARNDSMLFAIVGAVAVGSILFVLLLLIVLRADRIIARIHARLIRDQQELRAAQEQNIRSARLAAVGELVSGVAHELNNPLAAIWGRAQLITNKKPDPGLRRDLESISREAKRSIDIVQNLLTFVRQGQGTNKNNVQINDAIKSALDLRRYELKVNNIELVEEYGLDLPLVEANGQEIQQVMINLIVNAEQAMLKAGDQGRLQLRTEKEDDFVQITLVDTGPGIAEEHLPKMFEPFFTTKEPGEGTGLGLSTCYGIIEDHGGTITAANVQPTGAMFKIRLPITTKSDDPSN